MERDDLRAAIKWHREYRPEWDDEPDNYLEQRVVPWGRSRRLGMLVLGPVKAYIGVQHIDPTKAGWGFVDAPESRFFLSLFLHGRVVTLRTFPDMGAALDALHSFLSRSK